METSSSLELLVLLVLLSGLFSASETALISLSPARVRAMVEQKKRFANIIAKLKSHPDKLLISILIGNNIVNIWASVLAATVAEDMFGSDVLGYVVGALTLIILIFGEIIPKTLAQRFHVVFAQVLSPMLRLLGIVLYPLILLLEWIAKFFIWILGKEKFKSVTEDEVIAMLNIGHEEGEFNKQESEFIQNIFEFSDTTAEEIMVNRNEIEALSEDTTLEKALRMVTKSSHSRFPIYDTSIDNIIGYTTVKDVIKYSRRGGNMKKKLGDLRLHKILFFPVTKPINSIFKTFQQKRVHIAIILDEFGSTAGLITMEDVLEEIVGDIVDESDVEIQPIKKVSSSLYQLEANTTLEEIFEYVPFKVDLPGHKTVAFLIIQKLKAFPREGEKIKLEDEGIEFIVEKMAGKTIQKVRMVVGKKPSEEKKK
ncbi:MAG: hemolysin family protein [Candidatus Altimarinota bacterium]